MDSLEKLARFRHDFESSPMTSEPLDLALRTMLMAAGPMIEQLLPADPGDFDELLEQGAVALLRLRSDTASPIALTVGDEIDALEDVVEPAHMGAETPGE